MERLDVDTALEAANVALIGSQRRTASSFASIELRDATPKAASWDVVVGGVVGVCAVIAVLVAWMY